MRHDVAIERRRLLFLAGQGICRLNGESGNRDTGSAGQDHSGFEMTSVDLSEAFEKLCVEDDQLRIRNPYHVFEQCSSIGEVDRDVDGAEIVEAEPDSQDVVAVREPGEYVVALTDAETPQRMRG